MGVHRAVVIANDDPQRRGRLHVSIPSRNAALWAAPVVPIAAFIAHEVPVGAGVWIDFEDDDADLPVVLGLIEVPPRRDALARDLEAMGDAWDQGHAAGTTDAAGSTTPNPFR